MSWSFAVLCRFNSPTKPCMRFPPDTEPNLPYCTELFERTAATSLANHVLHIPRAFETASTTSLCFGPFHAPKSSSVDRIVRCTVMHNGGGGFVVLPLTPGTD